MKLYEELGLEYVDYYKLTEKELFRTLDGTETLKKSELLKESELSETEFNNQWQELLDETKDLVDKKTIKNNYWKKRMDYETIILKEKYLSNKKSNLMEDAYNKMESNCLFIADTGMGKSHATMELLIKLAEKDDKYYLFTLPNVSNIKQLLSDWDNDLIQGLYAGQTYDPKKRIILSTWESLNKIENNIFLRISDECHLHRTVASDEYRKEGIINLFNLNVEKYIDVTATPNSLDHTEYENIYYIKKQKETKIPVKIKIIDEKVMYNYILENVDETKRNLMIIQNKDAIEFLGDKLNDAVVLYSDKFNSFYNSDIKAEEAYQNIIQNSILKNRYTLATTLLTTGVNINNEEHIDLYIGKINSIIEIKQIIARFRKAKSVTVHLFYKAGSNKLKDFLSYYETILKYEFLNQEQANKLIEEYDINVNIPVINALYSVNESIYNRNYDFLTFKTMLNEYFSKVSIKDVKYNDYIKPINSKKEIKTFMKKIKKIPNKKEIERSSLPKYIKNILTAGNIKNNLIDICITNKHKAIEVRFIKDKLLNDIRLANKDSIDILNEVINDTIKQDFDKSELDVKSMLIKTIMDKKEIFLSVKYISDFISNKFYMKDKMFYIMDNKKYEEMLNDIFKTNLFKNTFIKERIKTLKEIC